MKDVDVNAFDSAPLYRDPALTREHRHLRNHEGAPDLDAFLFERSESRLVVRIFIHVADFKHAAHLGVGEVDFADCAVLTRPLGQLETIGLDLGRLPGARAKAVRILDMTALGVNVATRIHKVEHPNVNPLRDLR